MTSQVKSSQVKSSQVGWAKLGIFASLLLPSFACATTHSDVSSNPILPPYSLASQQEIRIWEKNWPDKVSRPKELPLQPLAKRCVNLSIHTASIRQTLQPFRISSEQTILGLIQKFFASSIPPVFSDLSTF